MRHAVLTAVLLCAVSAYTVAAQAQPLTGDPTASPEPVFARRVVLDALVVVVPLNAGAPCMILDAGHLLIHATTRLPDEPPYPTIFHFTGYRGVDPAAQADIPVGQQASSTVVTLAGGLYCWSIEVQAPVAFDDSLSVRSNYSQGVALSLVLFQP